MSLPLRNGNNIYKFRTQGSCYFVSRISMQKTTILNLFEITGKCAADESFSSWERLISRQSFLKVFDMTLINGLCIAVTAG